MEQKKRRWDNFADGQKDVMIQAQSSGGGVNSVALLILNLTGRIENPARLAIFADPGGEEVGTYTHLEIMRPWIEAHGGELLIRRGATNDRKAQAGVALYDYVLHVATAIPVHAETGLGRRQCTVNWKVENILAALRERGAGRRQPAVVQLGISWDEAHRMKDSPTKWVTHRWPLVELRLTREDCRRIIQAEGLPVPPKSRCFFCPLQTVGSWQRRAAEEPALFERAAQLEDTILARAATRRGVRAYLSSRMRPLREAFPPGQVAMFGADGEEGDCGGYCFT